MDEENNIDLKFAVCYKRMIAKVLNGKETIKEFNINKGEVGMCQDYLRWTHEGDSKSTRHDLIADLGAPIKGIPRKPSLQIYPILGKKIISKDPIPAFWVNGTYEDYLNNHKYYNPKDED
jgi:hypothetical protein